MKKIILNLAVAVATLQLFISCQKDNFNEEKLENNFSTKRTTNLSRVTPFESLKILTYNIHSYLAFVQKDEKERLNKIIEYIKQNKDKFDVIVFTELWRDDKKQLLGEKLKTIYPYNIHSNTHSASLGDGIFVLSKIPIGLTKFIKFTDGAGLDNIAPKGFWKIHFLNESTNNKRNEFVLFATHTQADEAHSTVRKKQFEQIKKEMETVKNFPTLLAGDLNVIGNSNEYNNMISIFPNLKDSFKTKNPANNGYTYDNTTNKLAKHFDGGTTIYQQRLDYILYNKNYFEVINSEIIKDCKYGNNNWDCSDHYGVYSTFKITKEKPFINYPYIYDTESEAIKAINNLKSAYGTGLTAKIIIHNNTDKTINYLNKTLWYHSDFYVVPPSKIPAGKFAITLASHDTGEATGVFNQLTYTFENNKFSFGTYVPWSHVYTNNVLVGFNEITYDQLSKNSNKKSEKKKGMYILKAKVSKGDSPYVKFSVSKK